MRRNSILLAARLALIVGGLVLALALAGCGGDSAADKQAKLCLVLANGNQLCRDDLTA